jgi:hypothetical protein
MYSPNATLRSAISLNNLTKKKFKFFFLKIFREIFKKKYFVAIGVPQSIWGMPAKILGV